jgi:hypothetical protein
MTMTTKGTVHQLAHPSDGVLIRLIETGEVEMKSASVARQLIKDGKAEQVSVSVDTNPPHLRNVERR